MIRLGLLAIMAAVIVGIVAGLSRTLVLLAKGGNPSFRKSKELGFFIPFGLLLIAYAMMTIPWGVGDVNDETALQLFWRASLLYFLAWALIGRCAQSATEAALSRFAEWVRT